MRFFNHQQKPTRLFRSALKIASVTGFCLIYVCVVSAGGGLSRRASGQELFTKTGKIKSKKINESSGLARSNFRADAFWTMNDSGGDKVLFLVHQSGRIIAELKLTDAKNRDWEAMASFRIGGESYLLVGDVGDNQEKRSHCKIYFVNEPKIEFDNGKPKKKQFKSEKAKTDFIEFKYEDGPRDCEGIGVDVSGGWIYLTQKKFLKSKYQNQPGIYRLPLPFNQNGKFERPKQHKRAKKKLTAQRIADFPHTGATGMAFSPDGKMAVVRVYLSSYLYRRQSGADGITPDWSDVFGQQTPSPMPVPIQLQGESVCFSQDGKSLVFTSEKVRQPIWWMDIDAALQSANSD